VLNVLYIVLQFNLNFPLAMHLHVDLDVIQCDFFLAESVSTGILLKTQTPWALILFPLKE